MRRSSGVLLHIASLPSPYGIGDLGDGAYLLADYLSLHKQSLWQVLPLVPVDPSRNYSPYSSTTAFAGNALFISPQQLAREGFIDQSALSMETPPPAGTIDYEAVAAFKSLVLDRAWRSFRQRPPDHDYENFCRENKDWLEDHALFTALRTRFGTNRWNEWPSDIRNRESGSLAAAREELAESVEREKFVQSIFFGQWRRLKKHCNEKGIQIIGDIPIYLNYGSADVWAHPDYFKLRHDRTPSVVAGVPPDYFSTTGQLWGNPVYNWEVMKEDGYRWWVQRMQHSLYMYDFVRIDHFRGFSAGWEIPASELVALSGYWVPGPGKSLFDTLFKRLPHLPVIAEDLGTITADVRELMRSYGIPGMKVLLFAFGDEMADHPYAPHNHTRNSVVYVGNHDTNTARGWFEHEATPEAKQRLFRYTGRQLTPDLVSQELTRLALMSVADHAIIPMQDILGLDGAARMNRPGAGGANWRWRMTEEQLCAPVFQALGDMTELYGRA